MSIAQRSTRNISHTCNNPPRRVAMPFRPWTQAQRLLRKHKISQRDIADKSGVDLSSVNRALSLRHFKKTGYASVVKVRLCCEQLLALKNNDFPGYPLWAEYDDALRDEEQL